MTGNLDSEPAIMADFPLVGWMVVLGPTLAITFWPYGQGRCEDLLMGTPGDWMVRFAWLVQVVWGFPAWVFLRATARHRAARGAEAAALSVVAICLWLASPLGIGVRERLDWWWATDCFSV